MSFEEWFQKEFGKRQSERNPLTVEQALYWAWCTAQKEQQAAIEADRRDALEQAAVTLSDWLHAPNNEKDDLDYAVPFMQLRIRALIPQPAPVTPPACPKCGKLMTRGSLWLCIDDGQIGTGTTLDAGQDGGGIGVRG